LVAIVAVVDPGLTCSAAPSAARPALTRLAVGGDQLWDRILS
jgi:hypothetical protein